MKQIVQIMIVAVLLVLSSCNSHQHTIIVTNTLGSERVDEVVTANIEHLPFSSKQLILIDKRTGQEVQNQPIDKDNNGIAEAVSFQTSLKDNETRQYIIKEGKSTIVPSEVKTFARFVPERTDDFAWENDRVAFRTYGPEAQRMTENNIPGGTLSSGIDCWLKKVNHSIIDKWYQGNIDQPGYYHSDHGEGLDNYHVGPSRGCGGTGVMSNGQLIASKNFTGYKVFKNGPVTSEFELDYAPYQVSDKTITERKVISIDLGKNLTKYVIFVEGTDTLTTGITLHDNAGTVSDNPRAVWLNYHTPHKGEMLSTAIVVHPKYFAAQTRVDSEVKDESHALLHLKVIDGKVEFYSGFAWSGSAQFKNNTAWENYLSNFAEGLIHPISVKVN